MDTLAERTDMSNPGGERTDLARRFKALEFDPGILLSLLNVVRDGAEIVMLPSFEGIPPDARVDGIYHDPRTYSICLRVSHPSFPVVRPGQSPDRIEGVLTTVRIPIIPLQLGADK